MTTLYIDSKKVSALYIDGKKVQLGDQVPQYLTIEPLSSATPDADKTSITLRNSGSTSLAGTFEAKLNDGAWTTVSWEDVSSGIDYNLVKACDSSKETISFGEKLQIRGLDKWNKDLSLKVTCAGGAKLSGKMVGSLTPEYSASTASYKLASFTGLKDASGLDLGDIVLASSCYNSMFSGCTSLTQAPALPATTLAIYCYSNMFSGCTSLTQAPALPATTLAGSCYVSMFYGCTSLTQAPALPATTLANNCYNSMFYNCSKVTELHYPASIQNDSKFTGMSGSPWFGADNADVYYDL